MDSTPTHQTKSASRDLQLINSDQSPKPIALRDLLHDLSPSPHFRKSKARLVERPEAERPEAAEEPLELAVPRRRCKSRASPMAVLGCGSPRNGVRRSRRRVEQEGREEREVGVGEEIVVVKPRRKKLSGRSRKEKLSPLVPSPTLLSSPKDTWEDDKRSLERFGQVISDLIMWRDMAKLSLWFGLGCLCFLSSCFAVDVKCSVFSVFSQLGLLLLAVSFLYNSLSQRTKSGSMHDFKLKEDHILRVARFIVPPANLVIAKTRELFSGEPSTTLKVAPLLLFGAEYGHLITLWRLCATGFFFSFTIPKLYSCYSMQIRRQVDSTRDKVMEAWGSCSHKKVVVASALTGFWNLSSIKTRILAAFVFVVIVRCCHRHSEEVTEEDIQNQSQQALVVVEQGSQLQ
ncbi:hypothetical protein Sjap_000340 [Stephania japonica]|uniref:Reticulon-like protein n=1 Tax=Stephania japonica TaxID=461633 RepID=A0AAP0PSC9_9MAGN